MAPSVSAHGPSSAAIDARGLRTRVDEVLNRWPVAGLAVAVVRDGSLAWFHGHGVSDVDSGASVDEDTVFRIGSMTKTMTAVAVLQLVEAGRLDLDAPVARGGLRLHPDADDPDVFHLDLTGLGIGTSRVVFGRGTRGEVNAVHLALQPMSFRRRPDAQNPRPWVTGALTAGTAALALRRVRRPR